MQRTLLTAIARSQVELNIAIICASMPSLRPLFERILQKVPSVQRSRAPSYYYGGRHDPSYYEENAAVQPYTRNLASDLEAPPSTYEPQMRTRDTAQANFVVAKPAEEEIQAQIYALSNHSSSMHSLAVSLTHPAHTLTKG
jgi:hypothetical protein